MRYLSLAAAALATILFSCTPAPKYRAAGRLDAPRAEAPVVGTPADASLEADSGIVALDTAAAADMGATALPAIVLSPPLADFDERRVMSPFGTREKPGSGGSVLHEGIDIDAETGEEVLAAAAGTISFAGPRRGYGTLVIIDHGSGISTSYGHLSAAGVRKGDFVLPGEHIGQVGARGNATGSHLHFEIRRGGVALDPSCYLWLDSQRPSRP